MEEKPQSHDLFALLARLRGDFSAFLNALDRPEEEDCLADMKRAAYQLYRAIGIACAAGATVVLISHRGGGRRHEIRTLGRLLPDGVTFRYSTEAHAPHCLSLCWPLAAQWIEVLHPA